NYGKVKSPSLPRSGIARTD
ncbi:polyphosphate kinase 2 family protein, partial [Vibrio parahaemolyticus V-223/04]